MFGGDWTLHSAAARVICWVLLLPHNASTFVAHHCHCTGPWTVDEQAPDSLGAGHSLCHLSLEVHRSRQDGTSPAHCYGRLQSVSFILNAFSARCTQCGAQNFHCGGRNEASLVQLSVCLSSSSPNLGLRVVGFHSNMVFKKGQFSEPCLQGRKVCHARRPVVHVTNGETWVWDSFPDFP